MPEYPHSKVTQKVTKLDYSAFTYLYADENENLGASRNTTSRS